MSFVDFEKGGSPETLTLNTTSIPIINADEVLVKVNAFGVNRADTLQRQGKYPPPKGESEILGLEIAGVVVAVGSDVTNVKEGERVFGLVAGGGYAQYAKILSAHVIKTPASLSCEQAAGIAEVFLTAYQSLCEIGQLQPKQSALIHAGASGVGLAAIQLANLIGAKIAVTASSPQKLQVCADLGAGTLVNYKEQDFAEVLSTERFKADVVIDFIGEQYTNRSLKVLNMDGCIVQLALLNGRFGDKLDMALLLGKRAKLQGSTLRNRSDEYKTKLIHDFSQGFLGEFESAKLKPIIDTIYAVEDIAKAHARMEVNDTIGKLICKW
ncbi:NAD(P)H-quinone oxidoreductase [Aliiglaciecola sp. 3_MG-2023]|uniref:NAD(P)H-quinone oxidoreductase n=1 Tax=Aliiglaciecola sp. 3_MG-2023 TaxID=3062644 RepID=UPI0026E38931|nr:NAD(P)H-quinone oxidoreductase [Aliiglaciecola sp. 3_MG-2023]MDO6693486.1 NAD(P)H-quinone oxidoreductase [Aliiglaciecola sp. 3_MG-2023]